MAKEQREEPKTQIAPRKSSLDVVQSNGGQWKPEQLDPELANIAMARLLVEKMGTPSRINAMFNTRKAMLIALNHREPVYDEQVLEQIHLEIDAHTRKMYPNSIHPHKIWMMEYPDEYTAMIAPAVIDPGNPTGYDCSLRLAAYEAWEKGSVNVDAWYGEKVWAFLMKPKMIITGLAGQAGLGEEEEPKESLIGRIWGKITGRGKSEQSNNSQ